MIEVVQSTKEISFVLTTSIAKKAYQFVNDINKKVLEDQLITKHLNEHEISEAWLKSMKEQKIESMNNENAEIWFMPYYGVDGSFGSPLYQFQVLPTCSKLKITHGYTHETIDFNSKRIVVVDSVAKNYRESISYTITGQELQNLIVWEEWSENIALSERYIYEFVSISIGTAVSVKNIETGNEINITDYDDW
jgi:hypothetical protein